MRVTSRVLNLVLAAVALAAGVVPLTLAAQSPGAKTAAPTTCDANAGTANLNFELKDIDGQNVALSAYKGKVILLDFWATWCGPCKIEIPWFMEFYTKYRSRGFVVLGVSVDDPVTKLRPFAKQLKMNYPVLVGDGRDDVKDAFGPLDVFPTSFVIGRDGRICRSHTGIAGKDQFEREIKALL